MYVKNRKKVKKPQAGRSEEKPGDSYSDLKKLCDELLSTEEDIRKEIYELGYESLSIEEFSTYPADSISGGQIAISKFLSLQRRCREFSLAKESLKNLVIVEPSRLHETIEVVEKILANNDERPISDFTHGRVQRHRHGRDHALYVVF